MKSQHPAGWRWCIGLLACVLASGSSQGAAFEWDPDLENDSAQGGSGVWDTSNTNWYDVVNFTNVIWAVGATNDEAVFNYVPGTVDLAAGTVTANRLSFYVDGFVLTNGTVTLAGATPTVFAESGVGVVLANGLGGAAGVQFFGPGSLTLAGPLSYAGTGLFSNAVVNLVGTTLPTNAPVTFQFGNTLDLGGAAQVVRSLAFFTNSVGVVRLTNGSLTVNGDANLDFSGRTGYTFDAGGLTDFVFSRSNRSIQIRPVTAVTGTTNTFRLPGAGAGNASITASTLLVGGGFGASANSAHMARLEFGRTNTFNLTTFALGGFNASGEAVFGAGVTNGKLVLRGQAGGVSRLPEWRVGETSSGNGGLVGNGRVDLTGGELDARVSLIRLGRGVAGAPTTNNGTIVMSAGVVDALELLMADSTNSNTVAGIALRSAVFQQVGGTATMPLITMGRQGQSNAAVAIITNNAQVLYNLAGGTLYAALITNGPGSFASTSFRQLALNGGTLRNLDTNTDLTLIGGSLTSFIGGTNTSTVVTDPGRNITFTTAAGSLFQFNGGRVRFELDPTSTLTSNAKFVVGNAVGSSGLVQWVSGTGSFGANQFFAMGDNTSATGVFQVVGGTVNLNQSSRILIGNRTRGTLAVSGGTLNVASSVTHLQVGGDIQFPGSNALGSLKVESGGLMTVNGSANQFVLGASSNSVLFPTTGEVRLDGGTLETARSITNGPGVGVVYFNGGTLRALTNLTPLVGVSTAVVQSGAAVIDSAGYSVGLNQALMHDPDLGVSPDGGLIKQGAGTLSLNGVSTYTGPTLISNGVLSGTGSVAGAVTLAGGTAVSPGPGVGTFTVGGALSVGAGSAYAWDFDGTNGDVVAAGSATFGGGWTLNVSGTLGAGPYTLISTVSGVSGFVTPTVTGATGTVSVSGNDVVFTPTAGPALTPFQVWQTNYFGTTTNLQAAYDADPDNDGANNLLEYAFNSDPTLGGSVNLPQTGTAGNFLTITVPRNPDATDVSYLVQGSTNLLAWATVSTLSATNPAPAGSTVTYTNGSGFDAFPAQFLRVKVTSP